jgi:hypothetical protein
MVPRSFILFCRKSEKESNEIAVLAVGISSKTIQMLPQSRSEKLAVAKDKLNKFQKTRSRTGQSIVLESAFIGTQVNGQQLSSMMSSHGGSSANGEKMSDTKTFKSIKSSCSSPKKHITGLGVENTYNTVLSPIKSEGALSLVNGLENLHIKSAERCVLLIDKSHILVGPLSF